MARNGGSGITFDKISVFSAEESLDKCEEILGKILKKYGYPGEVEELPERFVDDEDEEEKVPVVEEAEQEKEVSTPWLRGQYTDEE